MPEFIDELVIRQAHVTIGRERKRFWTGVNG